MRGVCAEGIDGNDVYVYTCQTGTFSTHQDVTIGPPHLSIEVVASVKTSSKIRQLLVVDIESKPTGY